MFTNHVCLPGHILPVHRLELVVIPTQARPLIYAYVELQDLERHISNICPEQSINGHVMQTWFPGSDKC